MKSIHKMLISFVVLIFCSLSFAQDETPPVETPEETTPKECYRMTLYIKCNSQGIVDKDWAVEFDVHDTTKPKDPDTGEHPKINEKPIKVSIPKGSRVSSAATRVAIAINMHAGEIDPNKGPASTEETPSDSPLGNKGAAHEKEDVKIKDGLEIGNVKKTCKGSDTKHLEVHTWKQKKEESGGDDRNADSTGRDKTVVVVQPVPAPVVNDTVRIDLDDAFAVFLGVRLNFVGVYNGGGPYLATYEYIYDGAMPLSQIATDLASWAQGEGFVVTWNSPTSFEIDFDGSGINVINKGFGAWLEFGANPDPLDQTLYWVSFHMD